MNISLNKYDYSDLEQFKDVLEDALSKKARTLRKRIALSLDTEKSYKDTLYHYLYWKLLEEFDSSYPTIETHQITVTETGGNGGYYLYDGFFRKKDNPVTFKVIPEGLFVDSVSANSEELDTLGNDEYEFTMPDKDVEINITYISSMTYKTIYYGTASVLGIIDVTSGTSAQVPMKTPFKFSAKYSNTTPGYIWVASELQLSTQQIPSLGDAYSITDTFNESTITVSGTTYYLYVHKWKTQVDKLTFSN